MMPRLRKDQAGFTLVELLTVMTIALGLLTATLTIFERGQRASRDNDQRTDAAEIARNGLDKQARQLRNLAKRLNTNQVIDTVSGFDFIFQSSDPARTWVRYCLQTTGSATPERGRLWMSQLAVSDPAAPSPVSDGMKADCPGTGWSQTTIVADHVTNRINGVDRPVFTYTCLDGTTACLAGGDTYDQIINVGSQLRVDTTPNKAPAELSVATGVHLRNQNQAPSAGFKMAVQATPARTVLFNGSESSDYEGRTLTYFWFKGAIPAESAVRCDRPTETVSGGVATLWGGTLIGEGVTLTHTFPSSDGTAQPVGLVVCDPGDRFDIATSTVVIP